MSATDRSQNEDRILILAEQPDALAAAEVLERFQFQPVVCDNAADLQHQLSEGAGVLILGEEALSDQLMGLVVPLLRHQPPWSDLPIIAVTSSQSLEKPRRLWESLKEAASLTVLERPLRSMTFVAAVQTGLRSRRRQYQIRWQLAEIHRLNEDLEKTVDKRTKVLVETTEQLETFCYSVAHDLRAPLRAQTGFAYALLDSYGEALGEEGREFANHILRAGERMDHLIQDLLAYAKVSREDLKLEPLNLAELARAAMDHLGITPQQAEIQIVEPLPSVLAHRISLELALSNFISNALKFVAPSVHPKVRIWAERRQDRVRLWIEDNGIGIPEEYQQKIFGIFQRLHRSEEYAGTGMGLAIVRKATEKMGGAVGVESRVGQGSRFWMELRAAD